MMEAAIVLFMFLTSKKGKPWLAAHSLPSFSSTFLVGMSALVAATKITYAGEWPQMAALSVALCVHLPERIYHNAVCVR